VNQPSALIVVHYVAWRWIWLLARPDGVRVEGEQVTSGVQYDDEADLSLRDFGVDMRIDLQKGSWNPGLGVGAGPDRGYAGRGERLNGSDHCAGA